MEHRHKLEIAMVREAITRVLEGRRTNLETAAVLLDRMLMETCPHGPDSWIRGWDEARDRAVTTCPPCGVSWYAHPEHGIE